MQIVCQENAHKFIHRTTFNFLAQTNKQETGFILLYMKFKRDCFEINTVYDAIIAGIIQRYMKHNSIAK